MTAQAHSKAHKTSYCHKRISFLFTTWHDTKWLCFLAMQDLTHRLGSIYQDSGAECLLCAQPSAPWPRSWTWATLRRALLLWLQNQPWNSERKQKREGSLTSLLASSLAFLSLCSPVQAKALYINLNLTIHLHLLFLSFQEAGNQCLWRNWPFLPV